MRPLEQPGLSPGQVPRHVGVGQWAHPDGKPCAWTGWTWLTGWFLGILVIYYLSLNLTGILVTLDPPDLES